MRLKDDSLRQVRSAKPMVVGIVGVQDGEIVRLLVFEDAGLGIDIIRESLVAIEMIGRDIQDHGDARMEVDDGLELKAGNFEDDPGFGLA